VQIQVVNQATQFIQQAFAWRSEGSSEKIDKAQFRKAKCSLYLYYRCQQPARSRLLRYDRLGCSWLSADMHVWRMVHRVLQGMLLEKQCTMPEATQAIVDDVDLVKSLLLVAVELVCLCMHGSLRM
jgi:hypothetical protein